MKSLRALHEDEQQEAAWLDAEQRFRRSVVDYERAQRQLSRAWGVVQIVLLIYCASTLILILLG